MITKTQNPSQKSNSFIIAVIICWIVIGLLYNSEFTQRIDFLRKTVSQISSLDQDQKNVFFQGRVYYAYQDLKETPEDSRILFLIPHIDYPGRSLLFLYPRKITAVASPEIALKELQNHQYDYVLINIISEINGGYILLNTFQENFWNPGNLTRLINKLQNTPENTTTDTMELLQQQGGVLLYKM